MKRLVSHTAIFARRPTSLAKNSARKRPGASSRAPVSAAAAEADVQRERPSILKRPSQPAELTTDRPAARAPRAFVVQPTAINPNGRVRRFNNLAKIAHRDGVAIIDADNRKPGRPPHCESCDWSPDGLSKSRCDLKKSRRGRLANSARPLLQLLPGLGALARDTRHSQKKRR
jgi:hypothetical protein